MIPSAIVYHHTANPSPKPQFILTNLEHMNRGFPKSKLGFFVGYHYFIGQDGTVKQARKEDEIGAHDVNCGCKTDLSGFKAGTINSHSIGICLAGSFNAHSQPTAMQIKALYELTVAIQRRWTIPDNKRFLHRETKATSCPGTNLRELVDSYAEAQEVIEKTKQLESAEKAFERAQEPRKSKLRIVIDALKAFLKR